MRTWVAVTALAILWPTGIVVAQDAPSDSQSKISITVGGLGSFQPEPQDGFNLPYLDHPIAGTVPGVFVAVAWRTAVGAIVTYEMSTTTSNEVMQTGRLVQGSNCARIVEDVCGPVLTRERDTLVSALVGFDGPFELKGGITALLGSVQQGTFEYGQTDAVGILALTVGADQNIPLGGRVALVPSFRYSVAFRGHQAQELGLGINIVRFGVGLRVRLGASVRGGP